MVFKRVAPPLDADAKSQLLAAITVTEKTFKRYYQILPRMSTSGSVCSTRTVIANCSSASAANKKVYHGDGRTLELQKFWACKPFLKHAMGILREASPAKDRKQVDDIDLAMPEPWDLTSNSNAHDLTSMRYLKHNAEGDLELPNSSKRLQLVANSLT